jgi:hypothetical protein
MSIVKDVGDKYIKDIIKELNKILEISNTYNPEKNQECPSYFIYMKGVKDGLKKAIEIIEEYRC